MSEGNRAEFREVRVMQVRSAVAAENAHLARLWHDAWHEAHAPLVPPELARLRTAENFLERLHAMLPDSRVVGPPGAPLGFCFVQGQELNQLFVSPEARGSGAAVALIADAEARLANRGIETAWLACAVGNERAARFYEKSGWHRAATVVNPAETAGGSFPLQVWRYEKRVTGASMARRPTLPARGAPRRLP